MHDCNQHGDGKQRDCEIDRGRLRRQQSTPLFQMKFAIYMLPATSCISSCRLDAWETQMQQHKAHGLDVENAIVLETCDDADSVAAITQLYKTFLNNSTEIPHSASNVRNINMGNGSSAVIVSTP